MKAISKLLIYPSLVFLTASLYSEELVELQRGGNEPAKEVLSESTGVAEHFDFNLDNWKGGEQLITRLKKGDQVVEYLRTSLTEFVVRDGGPGKLPCFKFLTSETAVSPNLRSSLLVAFCRDGGEVATLFINANGYFYIKASMRVPEFKAPEHYFPYRTLTAGEWVPSLLVTTRDYYPELGGIAMREKIAKAELTSIDQIEFTLSDQGNGERRDIFSISDSGLKKNGFNYEIFGMTSPFRLDRLSESHMLELVTDPKLDLTWLRNYLIQKGYDKSQFLAIVAQFEDAAAAKVISDKVSQAFAASASPEK